MSYSVWVRRFRGGLVGTAKKLQLLFLATAFLTALPLATAYGQDTSGDQCVPEDTNGTTVSINLADTDLPANDLVYQGAVQNPEQAWALHQAGVDLSTLDPDTSTDIWKGDASTATAGTALDAAFPVNNWDYITYLSNICSSSGVFRFNASTQATASGPGQTITLMLTKNIHTYLLRKELLRRLGYQIPAMKYLSNVKVVFPDVATRDQVLTVLIPDDTAGAATRWCSVAAETLAGDSSIPCAGVTGMPASDVNPTTVWFQDVVAMDATPIIYNVALDPPITQVPGSNPPQLEPEAERTLRALSVAYDLVDVPESINEFDWYAAEVQNGDVSFSVETQANFAATLDDAQWVERKIAALTADDLTAIVAAASYPDAIAQLLVQKLSARRNSLNSALNLKIADLPVDSTLTVGTQVENGKVQMQEETINGKQVPGWYGYADQFAFPDPQSPLHGLPWFFASMAESNGLENLVDYANNALPALTAEAGAIANQNQLTEQALEKYFSTGEAQSVPLGVWAAPVASGGLQLSRNIVMGEYEGTNQILQLADTFGFQATAGMIIGVNGLPSDVSVDGLVEASGAISVTHLMPLTSMKQAVTTPISKLLVPLVFADASSVFSQISALQNQPGMTPAQLKTALANDVDNLKNYIDVGESLIITESLNGLEQLSASILANIPGAPTVDASIGGTQIVLSRLHVFRKDQNTLQVFKDNGELAGIEFSLEFTVGTDVAAYPVASLTAQHTAGSADTNMYTINLYPDPVANPGIFAAASALAATLHTGSVETLEAIQKPAEVTVDFSDTSTTAQFFFWVWRSLKSSGTINVTLPDGTTGKFLSLSKGSQSGTSFQSVAQQAATFLLQQLSGSSTFVVDTQAAPDPGLTFLGSSKTRQVSFQARLAPGITTPYYQTNYFWEGWQMSASDLENLVNQLSQQYGFQLFPDGFEGSMTEIQLYELSLVISVYQAGYNALTGMTTDQIQAFEKTISDPNDCQEFIPNESALTPQEAFNCGLLMDFDLQITNFHKDTDPTKQGADVMSAFSDLEQLLSFQQFTALVGGVQNLYLSAQITGFQVGSETLSNPINSNTLGQADPLNPAGVLATVEQLLGINDAEFQMQWIRSFL